MTDFLWRKLNPDVSETLITSEETLNYKNNWKHEHLGKTQRIFVEEELKQLRQGDVPFVYNGFLKLLNLIDGNGHTFLDIGCATGYYCDVANTVYPEKIMYSGCDYNTHSIDIAKTKNPDVNFKVEDATKLSYKDDEFDIVMVSGVYEHVPEQKKAFNETCRIVKTWLICHRITLTSGGGTDDEYVTKGFQYQTEIIRYYYNRKAFIKRIEDRGFKLDSYIKIYPNNENIESFLFKKI